MKTIALLIPAIVILAGLFFVFNVSFGKKQTTTSRERITKAVKTQVGIIFLLAGSFTFYQVSAGEIIGPSASFGALLMIFLFLLPVGLLTGLVTILLGNGMDSLKKKLGSSKEE